MVSLDSKLNFDQGQGISSLKHMARNTNHQGSKTKEPKKEKNKKRYN